MKKKIAHNFDYLSLDKWREDLKGSISVKYGSGEHLAGKNTAKINVYETRQIIMTKADFLQFVRA